MSTMAPPQVGQEIGTFSRATGFEVWNRFAAVNDEFVPIHMDDEAGRAAGMASAFGMGNLQWSYLHNVLRRWLGDDGRVLELQCQFRSVNLKGQTVTASGRVVSVHPHDAGIEVEVEVWTEDEQGTTLARGSAKALVFDSD